MNFQNMPELEWEYGYPFALALMLGSVVGTFIFFRRREWI
jgi:magnesium transporter